MVTDDDMNRFSSDSLRENKPSGGFNSKLKRRRVADYVFPHVEEHAHDIDKYTMRSVEILNYLCKNKSKDDVRYIGNLLVYFTSDSEDGFMDKGKQKMVRYFSAATIYSQIMIKSFKASKQY